MKAKKLMAFLLALLIVLPIIPAGLLQADAVTKTDLENRIIDMCQKLGISNPNIYSS